MTAKLTFFPVGNGDMTLVETGQGNKILIDCNIRSGDEHADVVSQLKDILTTDDHGRLFIDLFIWTHPDEDHCRGISDNFHLGKPEDWNKSSGKIFIREIWASPLVFKRASNNHSLSPDAKNLNTEVKRRVEFHKNNPTKKEYGNNVLLITEAEDNKTDGISRIVVPIDSTIDLINGASDKTFKCTILGPAPTSELDEVEENLGKNHSSIIANVELVSSTKSSATAQHYLFGGDAEVVCWENLWDRSKDKNVLSYDILLTPHHCSWRSLSHDSWSDSKKQGTKAKVSESAHNALSQAETGAYIIASSNAIRDDGNDPPCVGARDEYKKISDRVEGSFKCVDDNKKDGKNKPLVIQIDDTDKSITPLTTLFTSGSGSKSVNRKGSDTYA